jgi:tetratricopeptide (TPR) repeat protein
VAGTSAPHIYRCERCGAESARAQGFVRQNSFGPGRRFRCRPCLELERDRAFPRHARLMATLAILGAGLLIAVPAQGGRAQGVRMLAALALNAVALPWLLAPLVIAVHEGGHWLAARAMGFDVHGVRIGAGRTLARFRWLGVPVTWAENPVLGMVQCSIRGRRLLRLRCLVMLLAGPATHLLWIALAVWLTDALGHRLLGFADGFRPLASLAMMNGALLIGNLLPLRVGELPTDGAQVLALPFLTQAQRERMVGERWALPARLAFVEGEFARAQSLVDEGLRECPGDLVLEAVASALAIERCEHERAHERLLALRARPELNDEQRAMLANDLAWNLHVRGRSEDVADADAFSLEAYLRLGEQPPVLSTRGGVLVDLGRAQEAFRLLVNAVEKVTDARPRASVLCDLARAEHLLGRPAVAQARLAEARAANPDCRLLPRTEAELAAEPRPVAPSPPAAERAPEPPAEAPILGRWLRRAAWIAVPACVVLWNCAPSYLAWSVIGSLPLHHADSGSLTPEQREECRAGLGRLARLQFGAELWPPLRRVWDSFGLVVQEAMLLECAGDVAAARSALREAVAQLEATLPPGPFQWEGDSEAVQAALHLSGVWSALARLEERAGDTAAALAALEHGRELAARLDGGQPWGDFGTSATVALGRHFVRRAETERARELYRSALASAEASGVEDATLVTLLQAYAELLEQGGEEGAASELYARIGRASYADPLD